MNSSSNSSFYKPPSSPSIKVRIVRLYIKFLSYFWQSKATKLLVNLFVHPRTNREEIIKKYKELDLFRFGQEGQFEFEGDTIFTYQEGVPQVLLVPGWESSAARFITIMEGLRNSGIGFFYIDLPSQGGSGGKINHAVKTSRLIRFILEKNLTIQTIIAHSFGGGSSFVAFSDVNPPSINSVKRLLTIGCPTNYISVISPFFAYLDVPQHMIPKFVEGLSSYVGMDFTKYDLATLNLHKELHVTMFHDKDDNVIPVSDAYRVSDRYETIVTNGLGHRRIMHDQKVVNQIVSETQEMLIGVTPN